MANRSNSPTTARLSYPSTKMIRVDPEDRISIALQTVLEVNSITKRAVDYVFAVNKLEFKSINGKGSGLAKNGDLAAKKLIDDAIKAKRIRDAKIRRGPMSVKLRREFDSAVAQLHLQPTDRPTSSEVAASIRRALEVSGLNHKGLKNG